MYSDGMLLLTYTVQQFTDYVETACLLFVAEGYTSLACHHERRADR